MTEATAIQEVFPACDRVREVLWRAAHSMPRGGPRRYRIAWEWDAVAAQGALPLLVILEAKAVDDPQWLARLRALSDRPKAYLMFTGPVPCQGIPERLAKLHLRRPEMIHVARARSPEEEGLLLERLLLALRSGQSRQRILDAWWEGQTLVVVNPQFKRLHVPVGRIAVLGGRPGKTLERFQIDEDGLFICWPELDVHLGWEQFAQAIGEADYLKARQESADFNARYGQAIRAFREARGLRQSDVQGLTPRQVGRIERGECRATHSALKKLAGAHGLAVSDYMAELADLLQRSPQAAAGSTVLLR